MDYTKVGPDQEISPYRGESRSTFHGRCLVVVKAGDEPGEIRLRAQAEGVEPAEVSLKVG